MYVYSVTQVRNPWQMSKNASVATSCVDCPLDCLVFVYLWFLYFLFIVLHKILNSSYTFDISYINLILCVCMCVCVSSWRWSKSYHLQQDWRNADGHCSGWGAAFQVELADWLTHLFQFLCWGVCFISVMVTGYCCHSWAKLICFSWSANAKIRRIKGAAVRQW